MTEESTQSANAEFAAFHNRLQELEDMLPGHIQQCKEHVKFIDSPKEECNWHAKDKDEKMKEFKETLTTVSKVVETAQDEHRNRKVLCKSDTEAVLQEIHAMHEVQIKTLNVYSGWQVFDLTVNIGPGLLISKPIS